MPPKEICRKTKRGYMQSFFLLDEALIASSRIQLHYLDLAVPNETLFKFHYDNIFRERNECRPHIFDAHGKNDRFYYPDDSIIALKMSNSFRLYAISKKWDPSLKRHFMSHFTKLQRPLSHLESAESAARFLKLASLCDLKHWGPRHWRSIDFVFCYSYPEILKGIKKRRCPIMMKNFWDLFCLTTKTRHLLFLKVPDEDHLKFMLEVANATRFDFWGMRFGGKRFTESVIMNYIHYDRCSLVTTLLSYGFTLGKLKTNETERTYCPGSNGVTSWIWKCVCDKPIPNGFIAWFLARSFASGWDLFQLPGFQEMFQKLFRSLPLLPSQPPSIVREKLRKAFKGILELEQLYTIYESCEDNDVVAPPKLTHQCRCAVRENLKENYRLPSGIDDLFLPTCIKRYLRLEF